MWTQNYTVGSLSTHTILSGCSKSRMVIYKLDNAEARLQSCHALIWHLVNTMAKVRAVANAAPPKKASKEGDSTNISAKPGIPVCMMFNNRGCSDQGDHLRDLHICASCLATVKCQCAHQEQFCHCKQFTEANSRAWEQHVDPPVPTTTHSVMDMDSARIMFFNDKDPCPPFPEPRLLHS